MNRRRFLKRTAALASAAAVPQFVPSSVFGAALMVLTMESAAKASASISSASG